MKGALATKGKGGSLAIFPAPHQYFYPLDFANNYGFTWHGSGYSKMPAGFGFGIRSRLMGTNVGYRGSPRPLAQSNI